VEKDDVPTFFVYAQFSKNLSNHIASLAPRNFLCIISSKEFAVHYKLQGISFALLAPRNFLCNISSKEFPMFIPTIYRVSHLPDKIVDRCHLTGYKAPLRSSPSSAVPSSPPIEQSSLPPEAITYSLSVDVLSNCQWGVESVANWYFFHKTSFYQRQSRALMVFTIFGCLF
jgi:hypothetical protein